MKFALFAFLASICIAAASVPALAVDSSAAERAMADALFGAGQFEQAEGMYDGVLAKSPNDVAALVRVGTMELYANRLSEARATLEKALRADPKSTEAKVLLAEAAYREDDFASAARAMRSAGAAAARLPTAASYSALVPDMLESFGATKPYAIDAPGDRTVLKFIKTDPLPIVHVKVDGHDAVFFIDTGADEVLLDSQFAKTLKVPRYSNVTGLFAGGQKASVGNGKIQSLRLGDWTVRNVPVQIIPTRPLSRTFGVPIDGAIGTIILSRFLSTMDYKNGQLILKPKSASLPKESPPGSVAMPFWLTGDHLIVLFGSINELPPTLWFLDSGMTSGVNVRRQIFNVAGITLDMAKAEAGQGGGGTYKVVPYTLGTVHLGGWTERNVPGIYDGPQTAEDRFGFYVQGLIGHRFFNPHIVTFDFTAMRIVIQ